MQALKEAGISFVIADEVLEGKSDKLAGKSIVIRSMVKGKNIFSSVREQDFIKVY